MRKLFWITALLFLVVSGWTVAADWPQWRGPQRNGRSAETGLLKAWPAGGPPRVWAISGLGEGFGSLALLGNRIFVQGTQGGQSALFCLNRADGKILWSKPIGRSEAQDRGNGPRGTPTLDGDRVYVLTETGDLAALKSADGALLWKRNILTDFNGMNPHWQVSESVLIDGNRLIVTPGGPQATIVALDKMTGKTLWTTKELSDSAGYSSCIAADVGGVRVLMTLTANAGVGVRASDGKLMWRYTAVANRTANITTPVFHDNKVFYTSGYNTGSALLGLEAANGEVTAKEIYFSRDMQNHHGGVILVGSHLYGYSNQILTCLDFATGKMAWRDRSVGKGSLTFADGNLYALSENNTVGLVRATPEGYQEHGRFQIEDQGRPSWAHPVVSGGKLYLRNQGMLSCYDVAVK